MAAPAYIKLTIDGTGHQIMRPPELAPKIEDVLEGEYTTCTGKLIADVIGWKFSDLELKWPGIPEEDIQVLASMRGECLLEFEAPDGQTYSERVVRSSVVGMKYRYKDGGRYWWGDVSCNVRFLDVHN